MDKELLHDTARPPWAFRNPSLEAPTYWEQLIRLQLKSQVDSPWAGGGNSFAAQRVVRVSFAVRALRVDLLSAF